MMELERRALLGDRQAQEECTRQGIVLLCPFCGMREGTVFNLAHSDLYAHKRTGKCALDGVIIYNLADWNTRPAPPIGRCKDCKYIDLELEKSVLCAIHDDEEMPNHGYCNYFDSKE